VLDEPEGIVVQPDALLVPMLTAYRIINFEIYDNSIYVVLDGHDANSRKSACVCQAFTNVSSNTHIDGSCSQLDPRVWKRINYKSSISTLLRL
jgi:hypothetical protein